MRHNRLGAARRNGRISLVTVNPSASSLSLIDQLDAAIGDAISAAYPDHSGADPLIRPSDHADLQANVALALAKKVGTSPREVAAQITSHLAGSPLIGAAEISCPGLINLTLTDEAWWEQLRTRFSAPSPCVPVTQAGVPTFVDYSALNTANEMHVGQLRSSITGDALVRILGFLGS